MRRKLSYNALRLYKQFAETAASVDHSSLSQPAQLAFSYCRALSSSRDPFYFMIAHRRPSLTPANYQSSMAVCIPTPYSVASLLPSFRHNQGLPPAHSRSIHLSTLKFQLTHSNSDREVRNTTPTATAAAYVPAADSPSESSIPPVTTRGAAKHTREMQAVNTAVVVNTGIFFAKVATWTLTSSGALLAEALHSLADIINQLLLRAGVQQSRRPPTAQHPFGFGREKYVYALMSAVGVFCIGAGASVVHGVQALFDPPALEHMGYSLGVLGLSAVAEMYSLRVALASMRQSANETGEGVWCHMMGGRDPTTAAVLAEDAGAVAGLGIAAAASYLTWVTSNPVYDAVGSIAVGCLMGAVAVMLIRNNKRFLIGQAMRPEMHALIVQHLMRDPMVLGVVDPKSEEIGDGIFRFKAEIQWSADRIVTKYLENRIDATKGRGNSLHAAMQAACTSPEVPSAQNDSLKDVMDLAMLEVGRGVIRTMGEEVDRLEDELRKMIPGLRYVDLETDRGRFGDCTAMECIIKSTDEDK